MASSPSFRRRVALRFGAAFVLLPLVVLGPAGTWRWPEAWAWIGILFLAMILIVTWTLRHDPAVLERRLETHEPERRQRWIVATSTIAAIGTFLVPGLDRRFGWSDVPTPFILAADALLVLAFVLFAWVLRTNAWAGRTICVEAGQQAVEGGPYALVRHPMYVSSLLVYLATPLALGSWWGLVPAALTIPTFLVRILAEEETLVRELAGYAAYRQRVRWRLVPGVW